MSTHNIENFRGETITQSFLFNPYMTPYNCIQFSNYLNSNLHFLHTIFDTNISIQDSINQLSNPHPIIYIPLYTL